MVMVTSDWRAVWYLSVALKGRTEIDFGISVPVARV
jgi:hypothetical protein